MKKLFLSSWDYSLAYKVYDCDIIKEYMLEKKIFECKNFYLVKKIKNFYLAKINLPLFDNNKFEDLREFLIFSRYDRKINFDNLESPLYVFVTHIKPNYNGTIENITRDNLEVDITAELYSSYEEAEKNIY